MFSLCFKRRLSPPRIQNLFLTLRGLLWLLALPKVTVTRFFRDEVSAGRRAGAPAPGGVGIAEKVPVCPRCGRSCAVTPAFVRALCAFSEAVAVSEGHHGGACPPAACTCRVEGQKEVGPSLRAAEGLDQAVTQ